MLLDSERCYQALTTHDARFDGLFFVGVATTGIYCRPICPAKTPHRENCRFFASAALAERAGFRPCLRCRPELAPGMAQIDAPHRAAVAAVRRIEDGALNEGTLDDLATHLGLSARQLRRVLREEVGLSPIELAQTQRLLLAKRLLTDSTLPITEVAFASGFSSVSRFNTLFRERYRLSPSDLRKSRAEAGEPTAADSIRLELTYRPPMAWEPLLGWLGGRAFAGAEQVEGERYCRTVRLGEHAGWLSVEPAAGKDALQLEVSHSLAPVLMGVLARVKHLFDLHANPVPIADHLRADPRLAPALERHPGLRVPGAFDGFELGLRAILGQQISVRAATTLAGRFVRAFGEPITTPQPGLTHLSPRPQPIAEADLSELTALGVTRSRAVSLQSLARAVAGGEIRLEPGADIEQMLARLTALPGIGDWTAQYIALRALRWPDAFPASDLVLRQVLGGVSTAQVRTLAEPWRPWRAYAAMHLWNSLEKKP